MPNAEAYKSKPDPGEPPHASTETGAAAEANSGKTTPGFTGILRPLGLIDRALAFFEAAILVTGILAMAIISVANVIGRFGFGQSLYFAEEATQFLVILVTFAGIGFAARHGRHIRMSAIYDELPDKARKALMIVIALVTAAIMFLLAWYSLLYVLSVYDSGRIAPVTQIPIFLTLVWLPIGFIITGIQYLLTVVANLTRKDVYLSVSVVDSYDDRETAV
ncbi:TRAP dicarboxylate transporter, DctQ subunit [Fulvimarina pelagi HTCC2506]|uniref:TRAP transporter small permease protein n=1 Tax=Fulvimarina pelagi HTCC2506 TaxID=314231 RepID=Q0G406_9HYPH|nr:TRAP transporter small permease [Fulvimarina pelagi]EAU41675.1 TRAP dicarboxylate transporter, DctQ subunit [Fulvimarina pelagi HTCC2506]